MSFKNQAEIYQHLLGGGQVRQTTGSGKRIVKLMSGRLVERALVDKYGYAWESCPANFCDFERWEIFEDDDKPIPPPRLYAYVSPGMAAKRSLQEPPIEVIQVMHFIYDEGDAFVIEDVLMSRAPEYDITLGD